MGDSFEVKKQADKLRGSPEDDMGDSFEVKKLVNELLGSPEDERGDDSFELKKQAAELRDDFNRMASKLDKHVKNVNISRVFGGSAGVAGAITAVVGFALIPVTFGSSALVGAAVGSFIAAAGGLTAGGASITKLIIEKLKLKQVQAKWDDFCERLLAELEKQGPEIVQKLLNQDLNPTTNEADKAGTESAASAVGTATSPSIKAGVTTAKSAASVVRRAASSIKVGVGAARAASSSGAEGVARLAAISARGSIFLSVVMVGVSLYDIVDGSIELYKRKGSKAGDYFRELAQSLDEFTRSGLTEEYLLKAVEMQRGVRHQT